MCLNPWAVRPGGPHVGVNEGVVSAPQDPRLGGSREPQDPFLGSRFLGTPGKSPE